MNLALFSALLAFVVGWIVRGRANQIRLDERYTQGKVDGFYECFTMADDFALDERKALIADVQPTHIRRVK